MFVAIKGDHHDGNNYIKELYSRGIRFFLSDQKLSYPNYPDAAFCVVKDSLTAFQIIAAERRRTFSGELIAITGSNGKTIVKEWLYQTLQHSKKVVRSPRSYNSQLGVPLSIWQITNKYNTAIIEAGISLPGEMDRLEKIIKPDIGILTNIGPAHRENFFSDSSKLEEKLVLFKSCKKLIYRKELKVEGRDIDSFLSNIQGELISWSLEGKAKYSFTVAERTIENIRVNLHQSGGVKEFLIPFADDASLENALHVVTTLLELGIDANDAATLLNYLEPIEMRLETLKGIFGTTLVNDVYNSDLAGLGIAVDVLMQQTQHQKKVVILSDVYQSGMDDRALYSDVANLLKFRQIESIYCIGKNISAQKDVFPDSTKYFVDTESFLKEFNHSEIENSAVLIKGARSFHFENITKTLQLQLHQTVLEINLNELIHNLNYYRSLVKASTRIMVMVKALSYGSGGHEIAGLLQHEKVDYLAVAFPDEGVSLRRSGIKIPILVMNAGINDYRQILESRLEPEIFSREGLTSFIKECSYLGLADQPIHLKLDTGMHRLGFEKEDIEWLKQNLGGGEIKLASIFSHLAGSDDDSLDFFTQQQVEEFLNLAEALRPVSDSDTMLHILNSAGIERFPQYQMDLVRIGIGIYGQGISKSLLPVSTYKTHISQIRKVSKGDTIGYGRKGNVKKNSLIATIPVGYADGIDRRLGNGNFAFYINGNFVPIIGDICMDMTMLDVSGINVDVGDQVELFGKNVSVKDIAEELDTIVYEILTSIPERVKRVYIRE
jgi:alanine racemase